jgi:hypothetical protein
LKGVEKMANKNRLLKVWHLKPLKFCQVKLHLRPASLSLAVHLVKQKKAEDNRCVQDGKGE